MPVLNDFEATKKSVYKAAMPSIFKNIMTRLSQVVLQVLAAGDEETVGVLSASLTSGLGNPSCVVGQNVQGDAHLHERNMKHILLVPSCSKLAILDFRYPREEPLDSVPSI